MSATVATAPRLRQAPATTIWSIDAAASRAEFAVIVVATLAPAVSTTGMPGPHLVA